MIINPEGVYIKFNNLSEDEQLDFLFHIFKYTQYNIPTGKIVSMIMVPKNKEVDKK